MRRVLTLLLLSACSAVAQTYETRVTPLPEENLSAPCDYEMTLLSGGRSIRAVWVLYDRGLDIMKFYSDPDVVSFARRHDMAMMMAHHCAGKNAPGGANEMDMIPSHGFGRALFTALDQFRGDSSLSTWLSRIALNEALGRLRRRRPTVDLEVVEKRPPSQHQIIPFPAASQQLDPERAMAQREIQHLLEQAIDDLPQAFRTVLVARVIEEMSVKETAELLGLRVETVKTRLHRARELLKQALEKHADSALTDVFPFDGRRCDRMTNVVLQRIGLLA